MTWKYLDLYVVFCVEDVRILIFKECVVCVYTRYTLFVECVKKNVE